MARQNRGGVVARDEHRKSRRFFGALFAVLAVVSRRRAASRGDRGGDSRDAAATDPHRRRLQRERVRVERQNVARAPRPARRGGGAESPRARRHEHVPAAGRRRRRRARAGGRHAHAARRRKRLRKVRRHSRRVEGRLGLDRAQRPVARRREELGFTDPRERHGVHRGARRVRVQDLSHQRRLARARPRGTLARIPLPVRADGTREVLARRSRDGKDAHRSRRVPDGERVGFRVRVIRSRRRRFVFRTATRGSVGPPRPETDARRGGDVFDVVAVSAGRRRARKRQSAGYRVPAARRAVAASRAHQTLQRCHRARAGTRTRRQMRVRLLRQVQRPDGPVRGGGHDHHAGIPRAVSFLPPRERRGDGKSRGRVERRLQRVRGGEVRGPHPRRPVRRSRRGERDVRSAVVFGRAGKALRERFVRDEKGNRRDGARVQLERALGRARRVPSRTAVGVVQNRDRDDGAGRRADEEARGRVVFAEERERRERKRAARLVRRVFVPSQRREVEVRETHRLLDRRRRLTPRGAVERERRLGDEPVAAREQPVVAIGRKRDISRSGSLLQDSEQDLRRGGVRRSRVVVRVFLIRVGRSARDETGNVPHLERGGLNRPRGRVAEQREARRKGALARRERQRNRRRARRAERSDAREVRRLARRFALRVGFRAPIHEHGGKRALLRRRQRLAVGGEGDTRHRLGVVQQDLPGRLGVVQRPDHRRLVRGVRDEPVASRGQGGARLARGADHGAQRQCGIFRLGSEPRGRLRSAPVRDRLGSRTPRRVRPRGRVRLEKVGNVGNVGRGDARRDCRLVGSVGSCRARSSRRVFFPIPEGAQRLRRPRVRLGRLSASSFFVFVVRVILVHRPRVEPRERRVRLGGRARLRGRALLVEGRRADEDAAHGDGASDLKALDGLERQTLGVAVHLAAFERVAKRRARVDAHAEPARVRRLQVVAHRAEAPDADGGRSGRLRSVQVGHADAHDFPAHLVVHGCVRARRARAVDAHEVNVRGVEARGVQANLKVRVRARQAQPGLAHLRETHEMRGGHVAVHHQRLAAEVLVHGLRHLPRAGHARAAPLEHVHDRGGGRRRRARRRHPARGGLEASKPGEGFGRQGVGSADGGDARVTRRAGTRGSRAAFPGPRDATVSRPGALERFGAGSSAGRARREVWRRAHRREARATSRALERKSFFK